MFLHPSILSLSLGRSSQKSKDSWILFQGSGVRELGDQIAVVFISVDMERPPSCNFLYFHGGASDYMHLASVSPMGEGPFPMALIDAVEILTRISRASLNIFNDSLDAFLSAHCMVPDVFVWLSSFFWNMLLLEIVLCCCF